MNENELKSLEVYNSKFKDDPASFNDFQANDYIRLLKKNENNDEAIEVGKTFMSLAPNLKGYLNQYGYALYNKYINIDDEKIKENENKLFGVEEELKGRCTLNQSYIARELAKWVKKKVEIKTLKNTKMNGALCHIDSGGKSVSITGANSLSGPSLGYINSKPMYLNIYTDDNELNYTLKSKFNEIWNNEDLLKDVKKDILNKIKYLYKDNSPEFLYFITLKL